MVNVGIQKVFVFLAAILRYLSTPRGWTDASMEKHRVICSSRPVEMAVLD